MKYVIDKNMLLLWPYQQVSIVDKCIVIYVYKQVIMLYLPRERETYCVVVFTLLYKNVYKHIEMLRWQRESEQESVLLCLLYFVYIQM